jgi:hypothetical protein
LSGKRVSHPEADQSYAGRKIKSCDEYAMVVINHRTPTTNTFPGIESNIKNRKKEQEILAKWEVCPIG